MILFLRQHSYAIYAFLRLLSTQYASPQLQCLPSLPKLATLSEAGLPLHHKLIQSVEQLQFQQRVSV